VPNSNTFLVTQAEREHVRQGARFQQHRDASCHQVFFFLQGKAPKEIHAILREITGEHAPSCTTVKNWVAQFKRGDFSTCDAPRPGWPKTVTIPEIIDQIQELIFEDCRISAKSIAEQLGTSRERVGSIIHEDLDMPKLSAKWVPKCLNAGQKRQRYHSSEQIWNFFGAINMISCRDWWPCKKPGYITMTRRQSNNQWSGGITAHPAPKNSECKNPLEKFSPRFFGSRRHPPHWLSSKRPNHKRGVSTLVQLKDILKEKRRGEVSKWGFFLHDNAPAHRALATQKKLAYLDFSCLDHTPYSPNLAPSDYHMFPGLKKKTIERSPFFVRRGGHCCRGDLVGRTTFGFFFLSGLQKLEQRAKKCIELRGEYVELIPSLVAVVYFLPGRTTDLSAPPPMYRQ